MREERCNSVIKATIEWRANQVIVHHKTNAEYLCGLNTKSKIEDEKIPSSWVAIECIDCELRRTHLCNQNFRSAAVPRRVVVYVYFFSCCFVKKTE